MKPESSQSKKDRLRKCEMASFLFAMSLCRRKAKPFAEMMKRISFIHLCAKEKDWQTVIYTLLGADDPQACVRTEEGATRCCNIRPRCINVKDRLGQTASFESGFSFLNPDLKDAAQSPGGPDVRFVHKSSLRMRPIQRQRVLFPSY